MYASVQLHMHQNSQNFPLIKWDKHLFMQKTLSWSSNWLSHGNNSVITNLFSLENEYLFPKLTVGVVKWIFCYKEGILIKTDPFPTNQCQIVNILL